MLLCTKEVMESGSMLFNKKKADDVAVTKKERSAILKPISSKQPSGINLRYESEYDDIRNARKSEENLPQGVWKHELKEANWQKVSDICKSALSNKSKDLQIALWQSESWFYLYQCDGLGQGLAITNDLLEKFWDTMYPYSDDDPEYRVAPLLWFDRELSKKILGIIIADPEGDSIKAVRYWDYRGKIVNPSNDPGAPAKVSEKITPETKFIHDAIEITPIEFYEELLENTANALNAVKSIEKFIGSKCKDFPGILLHLRTSLEEINNFSQITWDKKKGSWAPDLTGVKPVEKKSKGKKMSRNVTSNVGDIRTREQAYAALNDIADYLSAIEPHSPTPYLIRKAVSWGDMSLGEVMTELSQQGGDMQKAMQFLGMK